MRKVIFPLTIVAVAISEDKESLSADNILVPLSDEEHASAKQHNTGSNALKILSWSANVKSVWILKQIGFIDNAKWLTFSFLIIWLFDLWKIFEKHFING